MFEEKVVSVEEFEAKKQAWEEIEGLKSRVIEAEAEKRGYQTRRLSFDTMIITINNKDLLFRDMNGPLSSSAMNLLIDDKHLCRVLVKEAGLSVPESKDTRLTEVAQFLAFAETVGYPIVLKPNDLSRGMGVFTNIFNEKDLRNRLRKLTNLIGIDTEKVLVEKQFIGEDYRFFVVDEQVIACTKRARANVVGDGKQTIRQLIDEKNKGRLKNMAMKNYPIPTDVKSLNRLTPQGLTLEDVPKKGVKVILREESNIANGGESIDYTESCHPGPVSMFPWIGEPVDMAGPILDFYKQELKYL